MRWLFPLAMAPSRGNKKGALHIAKKLLVRLRTRCSRIPRRAVGAHDRQNQLLTFQPIINLIDMPIWFLHLGHLEANCPLTTSAPQNKRILSGVISSVTSTSLPVAQIGHLRGHFLRLLLLFITSLPICSLGGTDYNKH